MAQPMLEMLENRRLLAAQSLVTMTLLPDGTLEIVGTRKSDTIIINSHGPAGTNIADIVANDQPFQQFAELSKIRVLAGGGNDNISINSGLPIQLTVVGDKGN